MTERPILFSAPMVRAILKGRKTQTRRVLKPQPSKPFGGFFCDGMKWWTGDSLTGEVIESLRIPYAVADRLWVREAFSGPWTSRDMPPSRWSEHAWIWYWADGSPPDGDWTKPKPSIHMPRRFSRITLEVTEVRVQQLQDISDEDAQAEGCIHHHDPAGDGQNIIEQFSYLWQSIHGSGSWVANPWVAAITFRRVE